MLTIKEVEQGSLGEELGLCVGDQLVEFNGKKVNDLLDYLYYDAMEEFVLTVLHRTSAFNPNSQDAEQKNTGTQESKLENKFSENNLTERSENKLTEHIECEVEYEEIEYEVEKDVTESLGLSFVEELEIRRCCNNCVFCFIDQCAPNLRSTLYVKDDDWRHSFTRGNYVTLTNLKKGELDRICNMQFSPLYISVHATNPQLRQKILGTRVDCEILSKIKKMHKSGIEIHAQVVIVEGLNSGEHLSQTIADLSPYATSLAVVPVGVTKYSTSGIKPLTAHCSLSTIDIIEQAQKRNLKKYGKRVVFGADELYIYAGKKMPSFGEYEDFFQLENGVGLCVKLQREVEEFLLDFSRRGLYKAVSIATGMAAFPLISSLAKTIEMAIGTKINVYGIKNNFFGDMVNVSGLITGGDIISQLSGKELGERLFFTRSMLKEFNTVFLDDVSVSQLSDSLNVTAQAVGNTGEELVLAIAGEIE